MTRVATPGNEEFLLHIAEYGTANHMEYFVKEYQRCKLLQNAIEHENREQHKELTWHQDGVRKVHHHCSLTTSEGVQVIKALEIIQAESKRKKAEVNVNSNNVSAETRSDEKGPEEQLSQAYCQRELQQRINSWTGLEHLSI
ncbi:MAG: hypothetical protein ACJAVI_003881 [Candidatus Azotimanducaceae bacterium]|jgi:hypothetical protein